jgi:hypothetical protein
VTLAEVEAMNAGWRALAERGRAEGANGRRFREHRGGLMESLETTRVIEDRAHLLRVVRGCVGRSVRVDDETLSLSSQAIPSLGRNGDDGRIGWTDVHLVCVAGYGVVGMVEGDFPPERRA